ncbi:YceD family protein [Propioniciclava sp.]|uniref:YceD family protein n=1 Tax=Propioniciclava sp. TaxID=2038686 RepID=UPI00261BDF5C|nr:YceD family protein [Propioniciclava sp.]
MTRSIDPRSVLVFDIREFGHRAGSVKEIVTEVPAPEGIGSDVIGVPTDSPIALDLTLEGVGDGVLATGTAGVQLRGECARCLTEIEASAEVDLQELFLFPGVDADDAEASRVESEMIDLEPLLRDAVVLDLPFIPLCREDCAGLCSVCGVNLNDDPDHSHGEATDPRWAELVNWTTGADQ